MRPGSPPMRLVAARIAARSTIAGTPVKSCMFIDDSACNLASLNLMKFAQEDGGFDVEKFAHAVDVVFAAQEILEENFEGEGQRGDIQPGLC